jgi:flagellar transcriptional activator FlhC
MAKKSKSVLEESKAIQLAVELIKFGARLQLLEVEISLSRDRLINLYRELHGMSPPRGMLPFSVDWFLTWKPNVHSSLFIGIYRQLIEHTSARGIEAVIKAYKLYLEQVECYEGEEAMLSLTRAWTLLRFLNSLILVVVPCKTCGGEFVVQPYAQNHFVCGLCRVPNRAGKKVKVIDTVAIRLNSAA